MSNGLPGGWAKTRLAELCRNKSGNSKLIKGKLNPSPSEGCFPAFSASGQDVWYSEYEHDGAAIVLSAVGARCGKAFLADGQWSAIANTHVVWVDGPPELRDFLFLHLNNEHFWEKGGSAQPFVKVRATFDRSFSLPPLPEQKRIVAKLEALKARSDAAKEALDAIPPLLEKFRQSVLAAAFRGDLTRSWREQHQDVEPACELLKRIRAERRQRWEEANPRKTYVEPGPVDTAGLPELPDGWCWASLEELTSATRSICYGVVQPGEGPPDGVRLVRVCDLVGDQIEESGLRTIPREIDREYERSRLRGGEVLVTVVGTIGRVAVALATLNGANIARAVARMVPCTGVAGSWLSMALKTPRLQDWLVRESREVARKTLNIGTLVRAAVPIAPAAEMLDVVTRVEQILASEAALRAARAALEPSLVQMTQSILAKAFRGELVPQDPDDEPASVLLERIRAERTRAERNAAGRPDWRAGDEDNGDEPSAVTGPAVKPAPPRSRANRAAVVQPTQITVSSVTTTASVPASHGKQPVGQLAFGFGTQPAPASGQPALPGGPLAAALDLLRRHAGRDLARSDFIGQVPGLDEGRWLEVSRQLATHPEVVRTGVKRATRYRWSGAQDRSAN
jgi:type I restriction enzyme S subunit